MNPMHNLLLPLLVLSLLTPAHAATPAEWRSRSVYQLLTDRFALSNGSTTHLCDTSARRYCGGSYRGIIDQLDYIQGMGFTAIWISPVVKNIEGVTGWGEAYHGFWAQDINQLNPHFGTGEDLRALSDALHARKMYLMVDVVPNHFGHAGAVGKVQYSSYGAPFNTKDAFHDVCWITDHNDQRMVEDCWLGDKKVALPDVDTTLPWVQSAMNSWVKELVETYQIDGIRIDTARHMGKPFLSSFSASAGVYSVGEVYRGDPSYVCSYQGPINGVLNYPLYYTLTRAFQSPNGNMLEVATIVNIMGDHCADVSLFGTFSENHDQARFPSRTDDASLIKNVIVFTLITDGIPIIYAGQEHQFASRTDPYCREALWLTGFPRTTPLYTVIAKLNTLRNSLPSSHFLQKSQVLLSSSSVLVLRKSSMVSILTNWGEHMPARIVSVSGTGWSRGTWVVDVLTCYTVRVGFAGSVWVEIVQGAPRVLVPRGELEGSGLCSGVIVKEGMWGWGKAVAGRGRRMWAGVMGIEGKEL